MSDFKVTLQTQPILSSLLVELQENFPNKLPDKETSPTQLAFLQGQQKIISYIDMLLSTDEEN